MSNISRRTFGGMSAATAMSFCNLGHGIEPFQRVKPRIRGLSLTSYSFKPHMRWWWGKQTDGKLDMLGFLDYCAELGLDGAELTSYFFQLPVERAYLNQIKRRAHVLGLDITAGAMGNNFGYAPGSDEAKRELEYTRLWIDHFADLGAPAVRIFASKAPPKGANVEQVLKNVIANTYEALNYAEKRGVMLGMENHDFVKNIDRLLHVVKSIESPWFGVIWDSANLDAVEDPYAELARIAPFAIVAQIKVMTRVRGEEQPADFARLAKILNAGGYAGYLTFEYEEPEDPYKAIPGYVAELRRVIQSSGE